jgi:SOS-response transcriptional repressor LexA
MTNIVGLSARRAARQAKEAQLLEGAARRRVVRVRDAAMHTPGGGGYSPGDVAYVDTESPCRHLDVVVIAYPEGWEHLTLRQLVIEDGQRYLVAVNPNWPERIVPLPPGTEIIGVVIGKYVSAKCI